MLAVSSAFENVAVGEIPVETPVAPGAGVVETTRGVASAVTVVTVISVGGFCWFPLLSTARLLIDAGPGEVGVQLWLHVDEQKDRFCGKSKPVAKKNAADA